MIKEYSEIRIQQEMVIWFTNNFCLKHHTERCLIFSVPNEGQQHLSGAGVLGGVSDLIVMMPNKVIFFEVKTLIGKQSEKQKDFEKRVNILGFKYYLVRSLDDFQQCITQEK
jgi:hypothetical protein